MKNEKTYYVPVQCTLTSTLVVSAKTQCEAIEKVNLKIAMKKNSLETTFDNVRILESEIECKEDDEIFDEIVKDFNLTSEVTCESETITSTVSINGDKVEVDSNV